MRIQRLLILVAIVGFFPSLLCSQHSVAREWNEVLLEAIRNDLARPTVHARNLWHAAVVMHDAWAAYEENADTYFLGKTVGGYTCDFDSLYIPTNLEDKKIAQEMAISHAVSNLLESRFLASPGFFETNALIEELMSELGYDRGEEGTDYSSDSLASSLGNYLAQSIIEFGLQDGSNEQGGYENLYYSTVNDPLVVAFPGNPDLGDPNRWQQLTLDVFIDQAGNPIPINTPDFLSPEWGNVVPFALNEDDLTLYERDNGVYPVYHDPGQPPYIGDDSIAYLPDEYKWGFALVAVWSAHLDPGDSIMWDISPGAIGQVDDLPEDFLDYRSFYQLIEGGDPGVGWEVNPSTGQAYESQWVPRGDYARVLAEFWADGPDSETPPGHWFTILNTVMDHPLFERKFRGSGSVMDTLEYDVKAYFLMGAAMHDVAITAWGIKGYYDYIRPISAIRYMADQGQSSDTSLTNYHINGIPLIEGYIEVVVEGDTLAAGVPENVGKIKLYAWRGPDFIEEPETDVAGVGWILAENWWPYQRPSFVTPPFAGYVSGHSTYSRAAAEIMTMLTGDPFFPGGLGEFFAPKNEFLVFEDGPSVDVKLQWATYRDASDQTSLSRIWGGIHPPADDIPGRIIGLQIGHDVFNKAEDIFKRLSVSTDDPTIGYELARVYPNPISTGERLQIELDLLSGSVSEALIYDVQGRLVHKSAVRINENHPFAVIEWPNLPSGAYSGRLIGTEGVYYFKVFSTP